MKTKNDREKAQRLSELVKNILNRPDQPVGEHLSEKELVDYVMETLKEEAIRRVEQHLDSCLECATYMGRQLEAYEVWSGEQGKQQLTELRAQILETPPKPPEVYSLPQIRKQIIEWFDKVTKHFQPYLPAIQLAVESARSFEDEARSICKYKSPEHIFKAHAYEEKNGDLTFYFNLKQLKLADRKTGLDEVHSFMHSDLSKIEVKWHRVPHTDEWIARICISRDERFKLKNIEFKVE